jgi:uncharacterized protein (DUF1800 family)
MSQMSRRQFWAPLEPAKQDAEVQPITPPNALAHLMSRTSFGIRQSEIDFATRVGIDAWREAQLNPESINDAELDAAIALNMKSIAMSGPQLLAAYPLPDNKDQVVLAELRAATLLRQIFSGKQLFEVMVDFWTNHFSVDHPSQQILRVSKTLDDREIRTHALGKFRDLLHANAKGTAMLYYLDNYANVKGAPQENYARELMELHSLGVDGGYTEQDVKEVARAFTGWTYTRATLGFNFIARNHDTDAKVVLGHSLAANRGVEDGQDVLNILAAHPSTARFIATKLVRRFVSDAPPVALVDALAATFTRTDGDIRAVLRTLFTSMDFAASADLKVKRPIEYVIAALRVSEAKLSGTSYVRALNARLQQLGQVFCAWPAPNGYPDVQSYWINTTAWLSRWNYAFALSDGTLDRGISVPIEGLLGSAKTPAEIVDQLVFRILRRPLRASDRDSLIAFAADAQPIDRAIAAAQLIQRARDVLALLLSSRYFAYR